MKNMIKNALPVYKFILVIFVILLTACSAGVPSESDARSVLENDNNNITEGIIKIDSFSKTNGHKSGEAGGERYIVEFKADITYLKGFYENLPGQKKTISGECLFTMTEKGWRGEGCHSNGIR